MRPHLYLSTACIHDVHDKCRRHCKFCNVACACICHADEWPQSKLSKRESTLAAVALATIFIIGVAAWAFWIQGGPGF